jgi:ATP-binding cassette subfamily B protein
VKDSHSDAGDRLQRRKARPQRPAGPTLRRAIALNRPYRGTVALLLLVISFSAVVGLGPPLLMQRIVDDAILGRADTGLLNTLVLVMVAFVAAGALASVAQGYLSNAIGQGVMFDLRSRLYGHLSGMSLKWFTSNRTGEVLSRVTNDVGAVQGVVSDTLAGMVGNIITVATTFALMLALDWRLALFSVAFMPVFIFPARRVGNIQRGLLGESQEELAKLNGQMQETLSVSGALLVKTFGRQGAELERFDTTNARIRALNIRRALVGRWFRVAMGLFGSLAPVIVYWYGGHRVIGGEASLGTIIAFATLLGRMFGPVTSLLDVQVSLLSSLALFERLFDYLDLKHDIADQPGAKTLAAARGDVRFDHVSFRYAPDATLALDDVSFSVPAGQFAALVGHSGAGKTTAAYLIPRLYVVDGGSVQIDGIDVRDLALASVAGNVGMVNQEPYLFHTSIRENLRYARPDATDDEIEDAARAANIHDFVAGLPRGYDTVVGERGYRLSGGEKQRMAIARTLLKDPAILILDEATSSVDSGTERAIQAGLERLTRGRTVVAIAHRLSTILAADIIIVLDHGRVVDTGRHSELLARDGAYARLYRQQFSEGPAQGAAAG